MLPCTGLWNEIRLDEPSAELTVIDSEISGSKDGIIAKESTILSITGTVFTDFNKYGVRVLGIPNQVESPNNELTFTGNVFTNVKRPIHLEHIDAPVSIGQGNRFETLSPFSPFPASISELAAITINDCSSVVIAENNDIERYYAGVLAYGAPGSENHLVVDGLNVNGIDPNVSDGHAICTHCGFDGLPDGAGVNLRVQNSSFEFCRETIKSYVPDGGYFYMFDNDFTNNGALSVPSNIGSGYLASLSGNSPGPIRIHRNETTNTALGGGVRVIMPMWHAGTTGLSIRDNNFTTDRKAPLEFTLASGGLIEDNTFESLGSIAIDVENTDQAAFLDNDLTTTTGNGQVSGAIFLRNAQSSFLSCNHTQNGGAGLTFFGNCDGATLLRNYMENHIRGLSVYSIEGVGVIGQQPYRENRWNGGSTAEAALESFFVSNISQSFREYNQFTVGTNTGSRWPSPIIPAQPNNGTIDDWFHYNSGNPWPQFCAEESDRPLEELTVFEDDGIIGGGIVEPTGSEGKFRDAAFNVYRKLTENPDWLDADNQSWYNSANTASFQSRYAVYSKQKSLKDLNELTSLTKLSDELSGILIDIAKSDDGQHTNDRASYIADAEQKLVTLNATRQAYDGVLLSKMSDIQGDLQSWVPEEAADSLLKEVLTIYYDNLYLSFDDYPLLDQEMISSTAGLCITEYGEAVYLANAIANTIFEYDAIDACSSQSALRKAGAAPVAEASNRNQLSVYPSPSNGQVTIDVSVGQAATLNVYNLIGQVVESRILVEGDQSLNLDLSTQDDGMYLIELQLENGERYVEKLLLQR